MQVERAGLEDLERVAPLFDGYRQFYGQPSNVAAARAFLGERLRRDESVILLNDLFVSPDARRGGVARRLLERARQWAVETDARGLTLTTSVTNTAARALYESCGWRRDEEFAHYYLLV